ncbi:uncharacterized protein LOC141532196 [Cotesia typhae]|uniref:uncharacterized protein LOC141532196 n=1 Tax=Cotesia typhae TaxID=2053667 RepID=UPI003D68A2A3
MVGEELGCLSARKVLEFMWNHDLLSVYYLCEMQNSTMVFTLNPYARYAPAPWKLIDQFDDSDKNLVVFSLEYTKGSTICNSIIFDKTDHLENAEIKFVQLDEDKPFSEEENREYAESVVKIAFLMGKSLLLIMFTILMVMININQVSLAVINNFGSLMKTKNIFTQFLF